VCNDVASNAKVACLLTCLFRVPDDRRTMTISLPFLGNPTVGRLHKNFVVSLDQQRNYDSCLENSS